MGPARPVARQLLSPWVMKRFLAVAVLALVASSGCGDEGSSTGNRVVADECGGCALPPSCNPDGTAPSPYPACSCGCTPGQRFGDGVCNDNGCLVTPAGSGASARDMNVAEQMPRCGGCSTPPVCAADGTAPMPSPACSCGCFPGQSFVGGVCNDNGCLVPPGAIGSPDAAAEIDASPVSKAAGPDAGASPGSDAGASPGSDAAPADAIAPDAEPGRVVCAGDTAAGPAAPIVAPSLDDWNAVRQELPAQGDETALPSSIDPAVCAEGIWSVWLPFGSAYVQVHQRADGDCEMWLGGETESPTYDGSPTQYCRFPVSCLPVTPAYSSGGPAHIDSPFCVP